MTHSFTHSPPLHQLPLLPWSRCRGAAAPHADLLSSLLSVSTPDCPGGERRQLRRAEERRQDVPVSDVPGAPVPGADPHGAQCPAGGELVIKSAGRRGALL